MGWYAYIRPTRMSYAYFVCIFDSTEHALDKYNILVAKTSTKMLGTTNFPKVALPYIQDLEAISFEIVQSISLPTIIRSYQRLTAGSLCAFSDWAEYASDKYTIIPYETI